MSIQGARAIYLTDRSAVEADDTCGMKYWWNRKERGKGIVSVRESWPLIIGRETHKDLSTIAELEDISSENIQALISDILRPLTDDDKLIQSRMEILYRRLGWLASWAMFIEPAIRADFENVSVENEILLDRDPLYVAITPDRLLRHKREGWFKYIEYKTTISASKKWLESWKYAIQIHSSLRAVEEELKIKPKFAQIIGLMKGGKSYDNSRMYHPYVWGFYSESRKQWETAYEKARGSDWQAMPVWEYDGGIVEWVLKCGQEVAMAQFPHTEPLFYNHRLLDEWVARRTFREATIAQVEVAAQTDHALRNLYFEKRTKNCQPPFGDACPYLRACWNAEVNLNPLMDDEYEIRTPHHAIEDIGIERE